MAKLIICKGLPASGKTTFARKWVAEDIGNRARVNRDDLRDMMHDSVYVKGVTEKIIIYIEQNIIRSLLDKGISVVVDDTNMSYDIVNQLENIAKICNSESEIKSFIHIGVEECVRRNALREGKARIPESAIRNMHKIWISGT